MLDAAGTKNDVWLGTSAAAIGHETVRGRAVAPAPVAVHTRTLPGDLHYVPQLVGRDARHQLVYRHRRAALA